MHRYDLYSYMHDSVCPISYILCHILPDGFDYDQYHKAIFSEIRVIGFNEQMKLGHDTPPDK